MKAFVYIEQVGYDPDVSPPLEPYVGFTYMVVDTDNEVTVLPNGGYVMGGPLVLVHADTSLTVRSKIVAKVRDDMGMPLLPVVFVTGDKGIL